MKNRILGGVAVAGLMAGAAMAEEVRVYNWSDYIDEGLLEKFEQETGIELIYDVFDSNEVLETKLLAGVPAMTWWCHLAPSCSGKSRLEPSRSWTCPNCPTRAICGT